VLINFREFLFGIQRAQADLAVPGAARLSNPNCLESHSVVLVFKGDFLSNVDLWKADYASAMSAEVEGANHVPRTALTG
jgi:hypothetical protein